MAAGLTALLFFWYASPGTAALRALPEAVSPDTYVQAMGVSRREQAALVGEQRAEQLTPPRQVYALWGILPLRAVRTVTASPQVRVGGRAVGMVLYTKGVQVVGLAAVDTDTGAQSPASAAGLRQGDVILAVDGQAVTGVKQLSTLLHAGQGATLRVERGGQELSLSLRPVREAKSGQMKLGAWVRESTSGIGTLSFSEGKRFCALGHGITDLDTGVNLCAGRGFITPVELGPVVAAKNGRVGELTGAFSAAESEAMGSIDSNGDFGVAGELRPGQDIFGPALPLGEPEQVHTGAATLYSDAAGTWRAYDCRIIRTKVQSSPEVQGMMIEVTDTDLISLTGGIVPGMSGSPIVQDGYLVGVVTHVFVNEPKRGYCIYARWMYEKLIQK